MKNTLFYSCLFLLLALPSCNKNTAKITANKGELDQVIRVRYGSFVAIPSENLSISFNKVRESRCPVDVQCVQAGEANVSLTVTKANQSETLVLTAKGSCQSEDGSCGQEKSVLNYVVKLVNLRPYPGTGPEGKEFYNANLIVSKKGISGDQR